MFHSSKKQSCWSSVDFLEGTVLVTESPQFKRPPTFRFSAKNPNTLLPPTLKEQHNLTARSKRTRESNVRARSLENKRRKKKIIYIYCLYVEVVETALLFEFSPKNYISVRFHGRM